MNESVITYIQEEDEQKEFMINVYKWMSMGLFLTAAISYIVSQSFGLVQIIFGNPFVFFGLLIGEFIMVAYMAACVKKVSAFNAMLLFLVYSAVNGVTLSFIFLVYTTSSIFVSFAVTATTFAAMSIYGYLTKKDLTSIGSLCIMSLMGIIIASVVNIFYFNQITYWITTYLSILIFVGLTAYDTQKIKQINVIGNSGTEEDTKEAIYGALILYLDFINLLLQFLRLFGRRR